MPEQTLLSVQNLSIEAGNTTIIEGVDLDIKPGEMVGLVGESGSGKSVTALALMRLLAEPPMKIVSGQILFGESEILTLSERALRTLRGNEIAMIFQEPMTSLNPVFTVGQQIREMIHLHSNLSGPQANEKARNCWHALEFPRPRTRCSATRTSSLVVSVKGS